MPIPEENIANAVKLIIAELGKEGIKAIGGPTWWQWRRKDTKLRAEWIEMRSDYNTRQRENKKCRRIMLYVHGGGYFFGSVDEHRYQLQRHARKLQARVFAPRYRLAPQFPFPCGLLDCLAAYLYLLTIHEPSEIILAGDSAGGGMILSILCLLRDQQMPLPAGAILISPWVDLTHSFPSLTREDELDYIPPHGFMQKPSRSWPPPTEDDIHEIVRIANESGSKVSDSSISKSDDDRESPLPEATILTARLQPSLSLQLDGKNILVKDQVQLYTTNQLITHPLVSPALQPSLGGLPPLLIMVGDGELLRDEQIYVAHKAAHPERYKLHELYRKRYDPDDAILEKYPPTPVQLQVWEDLCHVTPTLSFTRPAKFMYRSIAQFGAWALSRAQKRAIEIMDDDYDDDSSSTSSEDETKSNSRDLTNGKPTPNGLHAQIGRAGDALPPFKDHMIREQVDRHGNVYPLPRASELPALQMAADLVGVVKEGPIRRWLAAKAEWDRRYQSQRRKIQRQRVAAYKQGNRLVYGDGEVPPPSALAGRQHGSEATKAQHLKKSWGLGLWSSWGWKDDERTVQKDVEYVKKEGKRERSRSHTAQSEEKNDLQSPAPTVGDRDSSENRPSFAARRKTVTVQDQGQVEDEEVQRSLSREKETYSHLSPPVVAIDPPTPLAEEPGTEQHVSPMFLPKWKNSPHLKNDSKDISDAGSTYSRMTAQDNMSTRAVFSAPGVQRQNSDLPESSTANTDDRVDSPSFDFRPSTPGPKDNLGGYDTPVSKRSVERLRSHQVDIDDQQSMHSSLPLGAAAPDARIEPMRSPSSMAIVHAEGVISPTEEEPPVVSETPSDHVQQRTETDTEKKSHPLPKAVIESTDKQGDAAINPTTVESSETPIQRPGLYNRDDSDFVTAMEKL